MPDWTSRPCGPPGRLAAGILPLPEQIAPVVLHLKTDPIMNQPRNPTHCPHPVMNDVRATRQPFLSEVAICSRILAPMLTQAKINPS